MSIFGSMRTAVSGMNAQANKLATVSDNIANVSTTAYKSASTAFSSLVVQSGTTSYTSGGVQTAVKYDVTAQGDTETTTSSTDLSIKGQGFFIVQAPDGSTVLSRAGDFTPDASGNLVNSSGYTLLGYSYGSGAPSVVVNGFNGLVPINVAQNGLVATPTTTGTFSGNLDASATVVTADLPSANNSSGTTTTDTLKSSIVGYDKLGNAVMYDVYFTKTAGAAAASGTTPATSGTWEVAVYRHDDAATGGTSSFPYTTAEVGSSSLAFSPTGALLSGGTFTITDPTTGGSIAMDMSSLQQLGTTFSGTGEMNGQAASKVTGVTINSDGLVSANYANSTSKILYQVPLATVSSPDKLTLESGNVYTANGESGVTVTGWANSSGLGSIVSNSLEKSNVDLANQLTDMIEAQKSYTANSKVFQTGSELMDVLDQLVR